MRNTGVVALALLGLLGCAGGSGLDLGSLLSGTGGELDTPTVIAGLKEALRVGSQRTVATTSRTDGYLGNPLIRIPLPKQLDSMASGLRAIGLGSQVDQLEVTMNRAAEQASGEALDVFAKAITSMSIADAWGILRGGDTAATDYFRSATSSELRTRFQPIVAQKMDALGVVRLYDDLLARYRAIPFSSLTKQPPELRSYVTDRALSGLFSVLGKEEAEIRRDPAARSSELLRRVFGSGS